MTRTQILIFMPTVADEEQAVIGKSVRHPLGQRQPDREPRAAFARTICPARTRRGYDHPTARSGWTDRSEEHTSELQSLMRISYAVFCLKKKSTDHTTISQSTTLKSIKRS